MLSLFRKESLIGSVPSALIVAFRRPANLSRLIESCLSNEVERIYIHLDGPRSASSEQETRACLLIAQTFQKQYPRSIRIRHSRQNLGTAVAVLSACNWIFEEEDYALILEDDCIPSDCFFKFVQQTESLVTTSPQVFAASGTQLAPSHLFQGEVCLSAYLMIWGWATSRDKWRQMFDELTTIDLKSMNRGSLSLAEFAYWRAGARRALQGLVDAWDIPLMLNFRLNNRVVVAPKHNLVTNIGADLVAINTDSRSKFTNVPLGRYQGFSIPPAYNPALDEWIRNQVFGISRRHLFSTKLTFLQDCKLGFSSKRGPLLSRLQSIHS